MCGDTEGLGRTGMHPDGRAHYHRGALSPSWVIGRNSPEADFPTNGANPSDGAGMPWWRVFPGEAGQMRELRRWIADLLPPSPVREDVTAVTCELASNAVCHTASGDGGQFSVSVIAKAEVVIVSVTDGGSDGEPELVRDPLAERGRGLRIVQALSSQIWVSGGPDGRVVYAKVPRAQVATSA